MYKKRNRSTIAGTGPYSLVGTSAPAAWHWSPCKGSNLKRSRPYSQEQEPSALVLLFLITLQAKESNQWEQDPIPLCRDLQHMLSSYTRAFNTCSAKKQSIANHVTSVSATELKKVQTNKEINNYRNQRGEYCEEGGPFPSHKIPQEKELNWNAQKKILFICQSNWYITEGD